MSAAVIDTNVLLVANGSHPDVSAACRVACIERLEARRREGVVVIDDAFRILGEYQHKTRPGQPKGVGDTFLKWLLQNKNNVNRVHQVSIHETAAERYVEFPDAGLQDAFDPSDRKFVAVSNAHPDKPAIWQAADSKWLAWWPALAAHGISVEFLCPADARAFYGEKFPDRPAPELPNGK
ncbi:MAG: hypothetical protein BGP24_18310 [Lysobacterales bacterium 69-70]|nr:hypothetical protein [Xanthomonadaceae bacterium]ODU32752.1 MAG: hypothetical protein ABS97_14620 [Xanthomonadaceae bacterium SCN 69-320]ODV15667.1 MAG: hypothetical protein ABT27_22175 [Xanthomonadaceae bacterium SCN 69-25]OJY99882.1 MAG: hypothetical protein BGP24_18310 [Xanthomonadales bacterium 69-70]